MKMLGGTRRLNSLSESTVEASALAWLEGPDWGVAHGPDIAPTHWPPSAPATGRCSCNSACAIPSPDSTRIFPPTRWEMPSAG